MRTKHWTIVITAGALAGLSARRLLRRRSADCRSGRFERRWVRVGGLHIHARVSLDPVPSERTPVVLVHGLGMSSRYMMPIARCLAPDFRVHAPDLPGFGLSDKPPHILTVPELADALAALMDAMGLRRAAFLGNSLGCEILVEFALRHPRRVERLILQGPTPDPKDCSALQQVLRFFVTGLFERWSLGWVAVSDYARSGVRRYAHTFQHMIANRIEPKLPKVQAPTLVVWGTRDYIISYRSIARMARLLPRGGLAVVPGAAHGMNYSHPSALRHAILPFLMQPPGATGAVEPRDG